MLVRHSTFFASLACLLWFSAGGCGVLDQLINAECRVDADCDDGVFCNGAETCDAGTCRAGAAPCPLPGSEVECGVYCSEPDGACITHACTNDADCDDGDFCDGQEVCVNCACTAGEPPDCDDGDPCTIDDCADNACANSSTVCDDGDICTADSCGAVSGECLHVDVVCEDDDLFCNGLPFCSRFRGGCVHSESDYDWACDSIGPCDEDRDVCIDAFDSEDCLAQCSLPLPTCDGRPLDEYNDFETALAEMEVYFEWADCDTFWPSVYVGTCEAVGLIVLGGSDGLHSVVDFYDVDTGQFVGQRAWSDAISPNCWGQSWWPVVVECDEALVTEVLCGTLVEVGGIAHVGVRALHTVPSGGP